MKAKQSLLIAAFRKIAAALLVQTFLGLTSFGAELPAESITQKLRWPHGLLQIAISTSVTRPNVNIKFGSDVTGSIARSLATWQKVVDIELRQTSSEKQSVSPSGKRGDGVSLITIAQTPENVLLFPGGTDDAAATTRVFYDKRGLVTEADIVLNPFQQFSTDGTFGTFDLESTLTHEIGHVLGLEHSDVLGATMHERYGRNGALGQDNLSARSLSMADIAEVRRLYGPLTEEIECCGKINGKLNTVDAKARNWQVWAEELSTGRVVAAAGTGSDGSFLFEGLPLESVAIYAQDRSSANVVSTSEPIFAVSKRMEGAVSNRKVQVSKADFQLDFLGVNGQLSDIALNVRAGTTYTVYLGGKKLDPSRISVGFTSPFLKVVPNTVQSVDYGSDVAVISFEMRVDDEAPTGEYTVFAAGETGAKRYIVGGIAVLQAAK
ncbi:MAG: matrixin family metalloprotease [Pyrinomonadaceae bacterium]